MSRRGALLLEVLIALSIFVGAAGVALAALSSIRLELRKQEDRRAAIDVAISRLVELEAGITTVERLNDAEYDSAEESFNATGDVEFDEREVGPKRWRIEVMTEASRFEGLTLVTLRVYDTQRALSEREERPTVTLYQLIRLERGGAGEPADFEEAEVPDE